MGEVFDITQNLPHISGEVVCLECRHEWMGVAPIGTTELECSECGTLKGAWKYMAAPEVVFECNCGNQHFYIDPEGVMCARCGSRQEF